MCGNRDRKQAKPVMKIMKINKEILANISIPVPKLFIFWLNDGWPISTVKLTYKGASFTEARVYCSDERPSLGCRSAAPTSSV